MRLWIVMSALLCTCAVCHGNNISNELKHMLQDQFILRTESDYRPAIYWDWEQLEKPQPTLQRVRQSPMYDIAAFILGYKDVVEVSKDDFETYVRNYPEMQDAIAKVATYYATTSRNTYILYYKNEKAMKNALLFLIADIDIYLKEQKYLKKKNIEYENGFNRSERDYLRGVCLGYPEEDIKYYLQRQAFLDSREISGEESLQFLEAMQKESPGKQHPGIQSFLGFVRKNKHKIDSHYETTKNAVKTFIQEHSLEDLEVSIEEYKIDYPEVLDNLYDYHEDINDLIRT